MAFAPLKPFTVVAWVAASTLLAGAAPTVA